MVMSSYFCILRKTLLKRTHVNNIFYFLFQLPPGTRNPGDNTPIDFSNLLEVLVYIILPILIVVFYMLWRKKKKKDEN